MKNALEANKMIMIAVIEQFCLFNGSHCKKISLHHCFLFGSECAFCGNNLVIRTPKQPYLINLMRIQRMDRRGKKQVLLESLSMEAAKEAICNEMQVRTFDVMEAFLLLFKKHATQTRW